MVLIGWHAQISNTPNAPTSTCGMLLDSIHCGILYTRKRYSCCRSTVSKPFKHNVWILLELYQAQSLLLVFCGKHQPFLGADPYIIMYHAMYHAVYHAISTYVYLATDPGWSQLPEGTECWRRLHRGQVPETGHLGHLGPPVPPMHGQRV